MSKKEYDHRHHNGMPFDPKANSRLHAAWIEKGNCCRRKQNHGALKDALYMQQYGTPHAKLLWVICCGGGRVPVVITRGTTLT